MSNLNKSSVYDFPDPALADEHGIVAYGGDLHPQRLIRAYQSGVFPWYDEYQPILWWSPDPRMVLFPEKLKVSKSMQQLLRQEKFKVTYNQNFKQVIKACAEIKRNAQAGTWILPEMIQAYLKLHKLGYAHSVEVWNQDRLVGGLYGIYLSEKKLFCGESMFSKESNASKFGFIHWVEKLKLLKVKLIDCQFYTSHLESLGAEEISREKFLYFLKTGKI